MLPAFDQCRSAVTAKPEQRVRADLDRSLKGQLQRPELWEFGEFSIFFFFFLSIGTRQRKLAANMTTDCQRKEDTNKKFGYGSLAEESLDGNYLGMKCKWYIPLKERVEK